MLLALAALVGCVSSTVDDDAFALAAVPTLTFDTDEGVGTGGVATLFHRQPGVEPYRDALTLNVFISSKLVQHHGLTWDAVQPFGFDGRAYLRLAYYSTVTENYCGVGDDVTCAGQRHATLMRFIRPYATAIVRPRLAGDVELLLGWRGALTIPGDLTARTPYPGSLFARDHPDGEAGFSSVPFVGVVVDGRDREVSPRRGFYTEASVRGAHPLVGATWTYAGVDLQLAGYFSLLADPRVVLAVRGIFDALVGDPSVEEMARIGGTLDRIAFGGASIGRGIREQRYLGKTKVIGQAELRASLFEHELFGAHFEHGCALFTDDAWVGYDADHPLKLLGTVGVSYRLLWDHDFAIRWDLATSPDEAEGPGFYIIVGEAF